MKSYCMQKQHFVDEDKVTWLKLPNGIRRRMCEDCKSDTLDRWKAEKEAKRKARDENK